MEVILLKDVKGLGKKGESKSVSDGYAKNFLIPRKLVVRKTEESLAELKKEQAEEAKRQEALKEEAIKAKEKLETIVVEFKLKAHADHTPAGSISTKEISSYVNKYIESSASGYCNFLDKTVEEQTLLMESYSSMPIIIDYIQNDAVWLEGTLSITLQKVLDNNKYITNAHIVSKESDIIISYSGNSSGSSSKISEQYPEPESARWGFLPRLQ